MKLAISGSRNYQDYATLKKVIQQLVPQATMIISGGAKGADRLAEQYARENNLELKIIRPQYDRYPFKAAPMIRNADIVNAADKVICFYHQTKTNGTADTAKKAVKAGKLLAEVLDDKVSLAKEDLRLF